MKTFDCIHDYFNKMMLVNIGYHMVIVYKLMKHVRGNPCYCRKTRYRCKWFYWNSVLNSL